LYGLSQLRQGVALHLNVADFSQCDISVWLYGNRLVEFRCRLELEIENVFAGDAVAGIAAVKGRSRRCNRRIDMVHAVSDGLLDRVGLLFRTFVVLTAGKGPCSAHYDQTRH